MIVIAENLNMRNKPYTEAVRNRKPETEFFRER